MLRLSYRDMMREQCENPTLSPEELERLKAHASIEAEIERKQIEDQGGDTKTSRPSRFIPGDEPQDGYRPFDRARLNFA